MSVHSGKYASLESKILRSNIRKIIIKQKKLRSQWIELDIKKQYFKHRLELEGITYNEL